MRSSIDRTDSGPARLDAAAVHDPLRGGSRVEATEEGINAEDADDPVVGGATSTSQWKVPNTRRLCMDCLYRLPIDGAAVSVRSGTSTNELLFATDVVGVSLDDLQFVLGEGPAPDAFRLRVPVLAADLDRDIVKWPGFAREAAAAGAAAVFAFPLHTGAVPFGVLVLYRNTPGELAESDLATALLLADAGAGLVLDDFTDLGLAPTTVEPDPAFGRVEVPQATGMIAVQRGCGIDQALVILRGVAFTQARPVIEVAMDVLAGRITFTDSPT